MSAQASALQGIEYTIYTFDQASARNDWQKHDTLNEMDRALKMAEGLFHTGKYHKVEVKQKYFDKKANRNIDVTLKVFEGAGKRKDLSVLLIVLFAVLCGAAAFGLTYILNR